MLSGFRSRSPLPPTAVTTTTTDALSDAIKSFRDCLEPDQKVRLEAIKAIPDAHAVAQFTHQLDQENAKRNSRCVAARISPLLESVQQFAGIVETFVSSNPHIAALVWASVKLVLQAIKVLRRTAHMQLLKAMTGSFSSEFAVIMVQIDQSSKEVKETIRLAEAKLSTTERQHQRAEREAAEKHRLSSMIYRKEREKFEADRVKQMQLEKRKIQQANKLEQLSDYNHKVAYWKARIQRHGSTGQWLTRSDEFNRWVTGSDPGVFWFTGILGSGKTVMTAFVVEQLSAHCNQCTEKLAYFFCQYDNETSLRATTILRSIIRQLLDQDDLIFTKHQSKIDALLENLHDLSLLEALFLEVVNCLKNVVVIIDGVDECSNAERKSLLKTLRNLMDGRPPGLKLYLAGDDRITGVIASFLAPSFVVNTRTPEAGSDLRVLIHQLVTALKDDGDLVTRDPSLYHEIVDILCTASQGM
ncbi:hypothetical protein KCU73_g4151, partial [Aureobasidium melanogenum]